MAHAGCDGYGCSPTLASFVGIGVSVPPSLVKNLPDIVRESNDGRLERLSVDWERSVPSAVDAAGALKESLTVVELAVEEDGCVDVAWSVPKAVEKLGVIPSAGRICGEAPKMAGTRETCGEAPKMPSAGAGQVNFVTPPEPEASVEKRPPGGGNWPCVSIGCSSMVRREQRPRTEKQALGSVQHRGLAVDRCPSLASCVCGCTRRADTLQYQEQLPTLILVCGYRAECGM